MAVVWPYYASLFPTSSLFPYRVNHRLSVTICMPLLFWIVGHFPFAVQFCFKGNIRISLATAIAARRESNFARYAKWAARDKRCCQTNSNLSYLVLCLRGVGYTELPSPIRKKHILFFVYLCSLCSVHYSLVLF